MDQHRLTLAPTDAPRLGAIGSGRPGRQQVVRHHHKLCQLRGDLFSLGLSALKRFGPGEKP